MKKKPTIYPIFMPHAGCPFQCVYCNQRAVTATARQLYSNESIVAHCLEELRRLAERAQGASNPGEIAFYGGTFTALPPEVLEAVLRAAALWVDRGAFTGIRFSTRPDGVRPEICALLTDYPVQTVEIGAQSLSDEVLNASRRGYGSETVRRAALLVKEHGWALGIQMMPGLPADTRERFLSSISGVIALRADLVRIYPTLVLQDTVLAAWYREGVYEPLSLDDAVAWCAQAYEDLLDANVPLARAGLHSDPQIEKPGTILGGPYHPAFGYLVRVRRWRDLVDMRLEMQGMSCTGGRLTLVVPQHSVSEVIGPRRANLSHWEKKWRMQSVWARGEPDCPEGHFVFQWE